MDAENRMRGLGRSCHGPQHDRRLGRGRERVLPQRLPRGVVLPTPAWRTCSPHNCGTRISDVYATRSAVPGYNNSPRKLTHCSFPRGSNRESHYCSRNLFSDSLSHGSVFVYAAFSPGKGGARVRPSGPEFAPPICVLPAGRHGGSGSPSLELRSLLSTRAKPRPAFVSGRGGAGKCHGAFYPFRAFTLPSPSPRNGREHLLDTRPCRHEGVREAPDAPPAHVQAQGAVGMLERAGAPTAASTGLGGGSEGSRGLSPGESGGFVKGRRALGGRGFQWRVGVQPSKGGTVERGGEGRGGEGMQHLETEARVARGWDAGSRRQGPRLARHCRILSLS